MSVLHGRQLFIYLNVLTAQLICYSGGMGSHPEKKKKISHTHHVLVTHGVTLACERVWRAKTTLPQKFWNGF